MIIKLFSAFTLIIALLSGCGGGGSIAPTVNNALPTPSNQSMGSTASAASRAASASTASNNTAQGAVTSLTSLIDSSGTLQNSEAVASARASAQDAILAATTAQGAAVSAAADLATASSFVVAMAAVQEVRPICASETTCTRIEVQTLSYRAAAAAREAAEASFFAIARVKRLQSVMTELDPTVDTSSVSSELTTATNQAIQAQTAANQAVDGYQSTTSLLGVEGPTVDKSTDTTGSITSAPTYSGNTQTIVTTFGNGQTSTATNTATSSAVTWAADNVTRTTTYSFANGGANAVVDTVPGTESSPSFATAVYPSDWTSGSNVTPPSVSARRTTFGNGVVVTHEDGSNELPFSQATLSSAEINDSNSFVDSTTTRYDLRWGLPDPDGPFYSAAFADGQVNFITGAEPVSLWGNVLSGQCALGPLLGFCLNGPSLATPHPEVLEAWRNGWTGKGVSVMIEDYLVGLSAYHGATVSLLAARYAIGSDYYGFNVPTGLGIFESSGAVAAPQSLVNLGAVNLSYGAALTSIIGRSDSGTWTQQELDAAALTYAPFASRHVERLTGVVGWDNFNYTDAVIVKAAGNDSIAADKEPLNKALAVTESINSRLLIVGALDRVGFVSDPASFAPYSNTAGTDTAIASRFLVASGTTPFGDGYLALNGIPISGTDFGPDGRTLSGGGTSYAAPRVTGYVAILRQKFPNLNAEKSSNIILDTARYDTLTCHPSCDPSIYGKGEASLSRALAPIGRLR